MIQSTPWVALAGDTRLPEESLPLRTGALTVALRMLPRVATVLADARVIAGGGVCSLALIAGQDVGVVIRMRGPGGQVLRHVLAADLHGHSGGAELTFAWIGGGDSQAAGRWRMSLCQSDGGALVQPAIGSGALALPMALGQALIAACATSRYVQAAGLRRAAPGRAGPEQIARGAAIAASSFLQTPGGLMPAAALGSGDAVVDLSGRELRLAEMRLAEVPSGFAFSPLRLHGAEGAELLIGPQARLSRPEGIMPASALGAVAAEPAARVVLMAVPVPDRPALLAVGGHWLACADPEGRLPQPVADLTGCRRAV